MRINEVSKETGLSKKAIEYYELKELITPERDERGYREFSHKDLELLKKIKFYRDFNFSIVEIRELIYSLNPKECLRRLLKIKSIELEADKKRSEILKNYIDNNKSDEAILALEALEKNMNVKQLLLKAFPGFYGRYFLIHFEKYLNVEITTGEQVEAFKEVKEFLDNVEGPKLPRQILIELEEALDFWTDKRLKEFEEKKESYLDNPKEFFIDNRKSLEDYMEIRESKEFKESSGGKIMEIMKSFGESSGYNDLFIPAMRRLSPLYDEYYKKLLKANDVFLKELKS